MPVKNPRTRVSPSFRPAGCVDPLPPRSSGTHHLSEGDTRVYDFLGDAFFTSSGMPGPSPSVSPLRTILTQCKLSERQEAGGV